MIGPMSNSPRAAAMPHLRAGAFFDVDNTLIPGVAIEVRFFRFLWRRRLVGWSETGRSAWFLLRGIPPVSLQALRERKLYLAGKRPEVIEPLAEEFIATEIRPGLSSGGAVALRRHQDAGHRLVFITGSLDFLIAPLARALNVEAVLAARPEQRDGHYTGHLLPPFPYGEGKRRLIESFAKSHGLDLTASFAYGDSPGDVEALRAVGHPLVVNPIRGMARIARRHGWPIAKWV
jgi:HAD superfamily hydrolase (TIGR01490 family)